MRLTRAGQEAEMDAELRDVRYETDGPVAVIRLDRPRYRNAQSWRLLDDLDTALARAAADESVRAIVLGGVGEHFSAGHDLGTPEQVEDRRSRNAPDEGPGYYDNFRKYNLDYTLRWRDLPKPTIAMVQGFCIFGGWMIAAAMDIVFAAEDALFLPGLVEYFSIPWDIGVRKAKEFVFESRFLPASEAERLGFVNRVLPATELERETIAYAHRVAENDPGVVRIAKHAINQMQDGQGFSQNMQTAFHDYLIAARLLRVVPPEARAARRLPGVDLALRRLDPVRYGKTE
jgi:enoyl-CoA hydratase